MQFAKQGICVFLLACVIAMNLVVPKADKDSIIGIKMCGWVYWSLELAFVGVCALMTWVAIRLSVAE